MRYIPRGKNCLCEKIWGLPKKKKKIHLESGNWCSQIFKNYELTKCIFLKKSKGTSHSHVHFFGLKVLLKRKCEKGRATSCHDCIWSFYIHTVECDTRLPWSFYIFGGIWYGVLLTSFLVLGSVFLMPCIRTMKWSRFYCRNGFPSRWSIEQVSNGGARWWT